MSTDTVDFFRQREATAWKQFLDTGTIEDLETWRTSLRALNEEIEARVQALFEAGRVHLSPVVRMSGFVKERP